MVNTITKCYAPAPPFPKQMEINDPAAPHNRITVWSYGAFLLTPTYKNTDLTLRRLVAQCLCNQPAHRPKLEDLLATITENLARIGNEGDNSDAAVRQWVTEAFGNPGSPPRSQWGNLNPADDWAQDGMRRRPNRVVSVPLSPATHICLAMPSPIVPVFFPASLSMLIGVRIILGRAPPARYGKRRRVGAALKATVAARFVTTSHRLTPVSHGSTNPLATQTLYVCCAHGPRGGYPSVRPPNLNITTPQPCCPLITQPNLHPTIHPPFHSHHSN